MATTHNEAVGLSLVGRNVLTTANPVIDNLAQSLTLGDTAVFGTNMVNALRFAFNRTAVDRFNDDFFDPRRPGDQGLQLLADAEMQLAVTGGFNISAATGDARHRRQQRLPGQRRPHAGAREPPDRARREPRVLDGRAETWARGGGKWTFNGQITGLGLADFLLGRVASLRAGQPYRRALPPVVPGAVCAGHLARDRAASRSTRACGGSRSSDSRSTQGAVANFSLDGLPAGRQEHPVRERAGRLHLSGRPGLSAGTSGFKKQWWNLSPRAGVAWDVPGDGRMAVRSSYGLDVRLPAGETWFNARRRRRRTATASPSPNPPGGFDDPYRDVGGNPHPIVDEPGHDVPAVRHVWRRSIRTSTRPASQSWNVSSNGRSATNWGASVSYLGSYSDRFGDWSTQNPGVYLGPGPARSTAWRYPVCTVARNLNNRRVLSLREPAGGAVHRQSRRCSTT